MLTGKKHIWCWLQVTLCDPYLSALEAFAKTCYTNRRYLYLYLCCKSLKGRYFARNNNNINNKIKVVEYHLYFVGLDRAEGWLNRQDHRVGVFDFPVKVDWQSGQVAYGVRPRWRHVDTSRFEVHHSGVVELHVRLILWTICYYLLQSIQTVPVVSPL